MSDVKGTPPNGGKGNPLEEAIQDAVQAVEQRERGAASGNPSDQDPASDPEPAAEDPVSALLKAKAELDEVTAKAKQDAVELRDRWLRAAADLENYKKRAAREREDVVKFGLERVLKDIVSLLDDLDRVLDSAPPGNTDAAFSGLLDGVRLVQRKFISTLERHSVTTFESVGLSFDPAQHEAVQQVHSDTVPAGAVAQQVRRGYFLNGRLLQPALVAVSLGKQADLQTEAKKDGV